MRHIIKYAHGIKTIALIPIPNKTFPINFTAAFTRFIQDKLFLLISIKYELQPLS